ncbi:FecR family protein [Aestuariivivens sediminis]|uniref:FecR family protein n=1 Tax=Aestuariivivens sediminis TaxID=2913557 RepID=UPI001F57AEDE|nr:FecR domain-containing protein [Aestuariivivens sediminis]
MDKEDLIRKWLNNDLSEAEKDMFTALDDAQLNHYIIHSAQRFKADEFFKVEDFSEFKAHYKARRQGSTRKSFGNYFLKIASVLIISLGIYFTFFSGDSEKIITLENQKLTIELPDHTIVELNARSEMVYDASDWSKVRTLNLKGEAFFEVSKGKPFKVTTDNGIVSVVGTKFNVNQREHFFEVKCYEGAVRVESDSITRVLHAGDVFKMINGSFSQERISASKPSWIDGMSTFESVPFKEVLSELERQYHIEITLTDTDSNRLFTGAFEHDNLENALTAITEPLNLIYEFRSSNEVVIHGKNN